MGEGGWVTEYLRAECSRHSQYLSLSLSPQQLENMLRDALELLQSAKSFSCRSLKMQNEARGQEMRHLETVSCMFDGDCWRDVIVISLLTNVTLKIMIVLRGSGFGS